jgi:nucleotide-binding universal stress UspA family protein
MPVIVVSSGVQSSSLLLVAGRREAARPVEESLMSEVVRPDSRRVVVGVHGSLTSLAALRMGLEEARARTAVLVPVLAWSPVGGELTYRKAPCPQLLDIWRRNAVDKLRTAFDEALGGVPTDVDVRAQLVRGEPGPALVGVASGTGDLLVVGAGHRSVMGRRIPGATARYCLRHSMGSVLLVPPPELLSRTAVLARLGWDEHDRPDGQHHAPISL